MGIALIPLPVEMITTVLLLIVPTSALLMLDVMSAITLQFALACHSIEETHMMKAVKYMVSNAQVLNIYAH